MKIDQQVYFYSFKEKMISFRTLVFFLGMWLLVACTLTNKINISISELQKYDDGYSWGGRYVYKNRKRVLNKLPNHYLYDVDTILVIEKLTGLDLNYSLTISGSPPKVFATKSYKPKPREVNYNLDTLYRPIFQEYIFGLIKKGQLDSVLEKSKKVPINTGMSSMYLSIITFDGNNIQSLGFPLMYFRTEEQQKVMDSLRKELNLPRKGSDPH